MLAVAMTSALVIVSNYIIKCMLVVSCLRKEKCNYKKYLNVTTKSIFLDLTWCDL